jgi:flagellar hook assembly protein FlgD
VAYGNGVNLGQVDPQNIQGCIDASNVIPIQVTSCSGLAQLNSFPSPTDGISNVSFQLVDEENAVLEVYDISGRLIQTLFNSEASSETAYTFEFDGSALPNGVYLYRLTTESDVIIEKFTIAH